MMSRRSLAGLAIAIAIALVTPLALSALAQPAAAAGPFTVTTTADARDIALGDGQCRTAAGACSLRAALQETNRAAGSSTITLPAGQYVLNSTDPGGFIAGSTSLDIAANVTLTGAGSASTIISGTNNRVFDIQRFLRDTRFAVSLSGITVTNGSAAVGAGIYMGRGVDVSMTDVRISGNNGTGTSSSGGGMYVWGEPGTASNVVLAGVNVSDNVAWQGGAIVNAYPSSMSITNSVIGNNTATGPFAGGIRNTGDMVVTGTRITGNRAATSTPLVASMGGGVFTGGPPNPAAGQRSSFYMRGGDLTGNGVALNKLSNGGGLQNQVAGTVTLDSVLVSGNWAFAGGGVNNDSGVMTVVDSRITGNTAFYGGGIYNNDFTPTDAFGASFGIERSAIFDNVATDNQCPTNLIPVGNVCGVGGGLFNENGSLAVVNSTVARNSAANHGGGIYNLRIGAGTISQALIRLFNATVSGNTAGLDGAGTLNNGGTMAFADSIVAQNSVNGSPNDCFLVPGSSNVTYGHNLDNDGRCLLNSPTDLHGDAQLGQLTENGGATPSMLPSGSSPVAGAANLARCAAAPVNGRDQRGLARPAGPGCEIGAIEVAEPRLVVTPNARPAVNRGNTWFFRSRLSGGAAESMAGFGLATDVPLACDLDGDGSRTLGVVRRGNGHLVWYSRSRNTSGVPDKVLLFGSDTDTPVCGDWDGDGRDTVGVVRANGPYLLWILSNSAEGGGQLSFFLFGVSTDSPLVGDWNGDGTDTIGITRGTTTGRLWVVRDTLVSGDVSAAFFYGSNSDLAIVGDWNGDSRDSIGVTRDSGGALLWLARDALTTGAPDVAFLYGAGTDIPVVWKGAGTGGR